MNVQTKSLQPALKHDVRSGLTLLPGEDEAAYHDFLGRVYAAVKPIDIIDEMLTNDVAFLQWDASRWRRLEASLMQMHGLKALEEFLREYLDYRKYWQYFETDLTNILQQDPAYQARGDALKLAHQCALNDQNANDKVNQILKRMNRTVKDVEDRARARKAENLAKAYLWRKLRAIELVDSLLAKAGSSIDALVAEAFTDELDDIERIDRLATIAETRRNAMLREIDRRRAVLGAALRRHMQEVDAEVIDRREVIEKTPAEAKNAA